MSLCSNPFWLDDWLQGQESEMIANTFNIDPTRTSLQRRSFVAEMTKRFAAVQKAVWHLIANDKVIVNAFDFATDPQKIDHFQKWVQRQINLHILETRTVTGNPSLKKPWLAPRIISAYKIGLARAYTDVKRAGGSPSTTGLNLTPEMKRAMDSAYEAGKLQRHLEAGMAVSTRKIELIYTRAYHDLEGVTQDMSMKLGRILATGMINGDSNHTIAKKMVQQISGISLRRAKLIAQTETTNAHAEGTLDGLEVQGVRHVTAQVEFNTMRDNKVCPKCKHLEGKRFTIKEARGKIAVHPGCRCSWLPV